MGETQGRDGRGRVLISSWERGTNSNAGLKVSHPINIPYHNSPRHHIQIPFDTFLSEFPRVLQEHMPKETHTHTHTDKRVVASLNTPRSFIL